MLEGFSETFMKRCLNSTMSILFVTKMGFAQQSTQAILNHFSNAGFFDFEYHKPVVEYTVGQILWSECLG